MKALSETNTYQEAGSGTKTCPTVEDTVDTADLGQLASSWTLDEHMTMPPKHKKNIPIKTNKPVGV